MEYRLTLSVWAYLVGATILEVILFYRLPAGFATNTSITILAASKAVLIVMYFMHLKYEPRPLQYLIFPPVILVTVLILTLVLSIGH